MNASEDFVKITLEKVSLTIPDTTAAALAHKIIQARIPEKSKMISEIF